MPEPQLNSFQNPPTTFFGTLRKLGPGMIIAGSIVGSGELIATTKTGAEAGFWLLWLIIVGCMIKVFCQVELGRYTLAHSQTPLDALNTVPGPKTKKANWLVWAWVIMTLLIITQQGGIIGGVGQAISLSFPLTNHAIDYNQLEDERIQLQMEEARLQRTTDAQDPAALTQVSEKLTQVTNQLKVLTDIKGKPYDTFIWVAIIGIITAIILFFGKYGLIQWVSTILVVLFSLLTMITLFMLQLNPDWAVSSTDIANGFSFKLPPAIGKVSGWGPVATALMAFGIIGVGSSELLIYPYWCMEKGYAKHTGKRDDSPEWQARAKGWMRVMRTDAWLSMVVYTFATIAFYLLGAAVLGRSGLNPDGGSMIHNLAQMYVPVFGENADTIFLFGAFAVLYSTLFVAAAGNARMVADGLGLFGLLSRDDETRLKWSRIISSIWILCATSLYILLGYVLKMDSPAMMVLACGLAQAIMLPLIGIAVLYFRYRHCISALKPGLLWDMFLWISFVGFILAGVVAIIVSINKYLTYLDSLTQGV